MDSKHTQTTFLFILLAAVITLSFFIFRPYLNSLFIAAALAVVFQPLYKKFLHFFNGQRALSALLTLAAFFIIVLIPITFFSVQIFQESAGVYSRLSSDEGSTNLFSTFTTVIEQNLRGFIPNISIDFSAYIQQGVSWIVQNLAKIFSGLASVLFGLFISMIAFYYFLKEGPRIEKFAVNLSPLPDRYDIAILTKLQSAIKSVVMGSLTIALIQGILTGVGFAIFGIPNAALWGSFAVIAALVPTVGTSLVMAPAVIYLLFIGSIVPAMGLAIWGVLAVGMIDNFLGPRLMERGISLHPLLILLSVLGGLSFFGPVGFILGPVILSLLFALLDIYKKEFQELLRNNN